MTDNSTNTQQAKKSSTDDGFDSILLTADDRDVLKDIFMDYDIMKTASLFNFDIPKSDKMLNAAITTILEVNTKHHLGLVSKIIDREKNCVAGVCGVVPLTWCEETKQPNVVELFCYIKKAYHGMYTVTTKPTAKTINKCFVSTEVQKVIASVLNSNLGSLACVVKMGLRFIGKICKDNSALIVFELDRKKYKILDKISHIREYIQEMMKSGQLYESSHIFFCSNFSKSFE